MPDPCEPCCGSIDPNVIVGIMCRSVTRTATLCGYSEFVPTDGSGVSVPPKKYRVRRLKEASVYTDTRIGSCANGEGAAQSKLVETKTINYIQAVWNVNCELQLFPVPCPNTTRRSTVSSPCPFSSTTTLCRSLTPENTPHPSVGTSSITATRTERVWSLDINYTFENGSIKHNTTVTQTFSIEDTMEDAVNRSSGGAEGTSCTSTAIKRTTGFTTTATAVKYRLEINDLLVGRTYRLTVYFQKASTLPNTDPNWVPPSEFTDVHEFQVPEKDDDPNTPEDESESTTNDVIIGEEFPWTDDTKTTLKPYDQWSGIQMPTEEGYNIYIARTTLRRIS